MARRSGVVCKTKEGGSCDDGSIVGEIDGVGGWKGL